MLQSTSLRSKLIVLSQQTQNTHLFGLRNSLTVLLVKLTAIFLLLNDIRENYITLATSYFHGVDCLTPKHTQATPTEPT